VGIRGMGIGDKADKVDKEDKGRKKLNFLLPPYD
jgi:hypothetical protein